MCCDVHACSGRAASLTKRRRPLPQRRAGGITRTQSRLPQAKTLRKGVNVLVATPGRLEDIMNDGAARLHHVTCAGSAADFHLEPQGCENSLKRETTFRVSIFKQSITQCVHSILINRSPMPGVDAA